MNTTRLSAVLPVEFLLLASACTQLLGYEEGHLEVTKGLAGGGGIASSGYGNALASGAKGVNIDSSDPDGTSGAWATTSGNTSSSNAGSAVAVATTIELPTDVHAGEIAGTAPSHSAAAGSPVDVGHGGRDSASRAIGGADVTGGVVSNGAGALNTAGGSNTASGTGASNAIGGTMSHRTGTSNALGGSSAIGGFGGSNATGGTASNTSTEAGCRSDIKSGAPCNPLVDTASCLLSLQLCTCSLLGLVWSCSE